MCKVWCSPHSVCCSFLFTTQKLYSINDNHHCPVDYYCCMNIIVAFNSLILYGKWCSQAVIDIIYTSYCCSPSSLLPLILLQCTLLSTACRNRLIQVDMLNNHIWNFVEYEHAVQSLKITKFNHKNAYCTRLRNIIPSEAWFLLGLNRDRMASAHIFCVASKKSFLLIRES